jgi:hypothetical protein
MRLITGFDSSSKQLITITTEDNYTFQFLLSYSTNRQGWFWSMAYNNFAVNNCRLNIGANILHRYKHTLPFGLMCTSDEPKLINPYRLDDLESGRIKLYSLSVDETSQVETDFYGQ